MEPLVFDSKEDIRKAYNTGDKEKDLEVINAVLTGNVAVKQDTPVDSQEQPPAETPVDQPAEASAPVVPEVVPAEELERQKKYAEFIEERNKEEKLKALEELAKKEQELAKEKKAREELEERLRRASETTSQTLPTTTTQDADEDEEYASEYAKKTRRMLEEIRSQVGDTTKIQALTAEFDTIKAEYERRKLDEETKRQEKERKEREEKVYNSIRDFQNKHPELKTEKDIQELDNEYVRFRNDIAHLVKARTVADIEKAVTEYRSGGEIKKLADSKGIVAMKDYDKYDLIANLIDMKNGIQFDPITQKEIPIVDDDGVRVRYRSLDEVYKIRKFEEELTNAKKQAYAEVGKKLAQLENAPVTLKPEQTEPFTTGFTVEQEREILSWNPEQWINNPEKRRMVEEVYAKRGLQPPKYRGRR